MRIMTVDEMADALRRAGFIVGKRDTRVNRNYPGSFMVIEDHEDSELPTDDGSNGPWAIVGDDLSSLIRQAYDIWKDEQVMNLVS